MSTSTSISPSTNTIPKSTHLIHLNHCITLAQSSPPKPTNFRVGCVLVSHSPTTSESGTVLSTGYTLELPGNTHAEQCALSKLTSQPDLHSLTTTPLPSTTPTPTPIPVTLYTSLEPCSVRLSGSLPCVQRIIEFNGTSTTHKITEVIFGAKEPGTFVQDSQSCRILSDAGVPWTYIPDLEEEILRVAMAGHVAKDEGAVKDENGAGSKTGSGNGPGSETKPSETRRAIDDITEEERRRQEALPRNPKKRMMDVGQEPGRT